MLGLLVVSYSRPVLSQRAEGLNTTSIASIALFVVVGGFLAWFLVRLIRRSAKKSPIKGSKTGVYASTTAGKKPFGLVVVVLYTLIAAAYEVISGFFAMAASEFAYAIFLPLGVLDLAVAYGLWTMQKWGLNLARAIYLVGILLGVVTVSITGISTTTDLLIVVEIVIGVLVLIYLFRPQTGALFQ